MTVWIGNDTAESHTDYRDDSILIFEFWQDPNVAGGFKIVFNTARDLGFSPQEGFCAQFAGLGSPGGA